MTTAGKEEALLLSDSRGKKQPEVFGSIHSGFVSNHYPHPWTPHFALTLTFSINQPCRDRVPSWRNTVINIRGKLEDTNKPQYS